MFIEKVPWFCLIAAFVCLTGVSSANSSSEDQFAENLQSKTLEMVTDFFWRNDSDVTQNFLLSPVSMATDTALLTSLVDNYQTLSLYPGFLQDLRNVTKHISMVTSGDVNFKTAFYVQAEADNDLLNRTASSAYPTDNFELLTQHKEVESNPLLAIYTTATCNITEDIGKGHRWVEPEDFFVSISSPIKVLALSLVNLYDYAEFHYPHLENCIAKALQMEYPGSSSPELSLIIVIPKNNDRSECSSPQNLLANMKDVDLRGLNFTSKRMFVTIPLFHFSSEVDLKKDLEATPFGEILTLKSKAFRDSVARHSMEILFEPKVPQPMVIPMIGLNTPSFSANRPFYFAVSHKTSQTPIFSGIINNPSIEEKTTTTPVPTL